MAIRRGVLSSLLQSSAARRSTAVSIADLSAKHHLLPPATSPPQYRRFISSKTSSTPDVIHRFLQSSSVTGTCVSTLSYKSILGLRCFSSTGSHIVVEMPALSPTMNQGNIAKWRKQEGDKIDVGDVICEIETDKATLEFESLEEGFLQSSSVTGTCVSTFSHKSILGLRCFSSAGSHIVVEMPALSPTMNQGNIAKWRKQEGDKIDVGDVICEIETDKATLEFESLEEGYLAKILAPEGSKDVLVGQPIAITVEDPDEIKNIPADISKKSEVKEEKSAQVVEHKESTQSTGFSRISPSAKLLLSEYELEASSLQASGPRGTLLKGDVLEAIKSGRGSKEVSRPPQEKASASAHTLPSTTQTLPQSGTSSPVMDAYEDLPNSQIRKVVMLK